VVLCGHSTFLLQWPQDSDFNTTSCMKTWIQCRVSVPYIDAIQIEISNDPADFQCPDSSKTSLRQQKCTTHINHSSTALAYLILKWQNQLWSSVTVASSGSSELRVPMQRAMALVFHCHSWVVDPRDHGPRRQGNKWKVMTPPMTLTPCWEWK
jgi:hypothetical protein